MPINSQVDNKNFNKKQNDEEIPNAVAGLNQPGSLKNQNQSHNTKKEALGRNTKR